MNQQIRYLLNQTAYISKLEVFKQKKNLFNNLNQSANGKF
jgi:hypothetical protein